MISSVSVLAIICPFTLQRRTVEIKNDRNIAYTTHRGRWGELDTEVVNCTLLENASRYKNRFGMK